MEIDLDLKVKLYKEYLENGGYEKIPFTELCESLMEVKTLPNGKVDPETVDSCVNAAMLAYIGTQLLEPYNSDKYLSQYETLLQKSIFFTQQNIETKSDFDEVFEKYSTSQNILFRGLNEAKYRLYSSLQREWITSKLYDRHESYKDFLAKLISNARLEEGKTLEKYLDKIGIDPENDLAVLSFLQHYGCPTPLLDWTYSFHNALFFALQNLRKPEGKWEIENYFCVYYLEEDFLKKASIQKIFDGVGLEKQKEKIKNDFVEKLRSQGIPDDSIASVVEKTLTPEYINKMFYMLHGKELMTYITKVERLIKESVIYFSDAQTDPHLKYNLYTNTNITNQDGVFIWNSSPTKPVEQVVIEQSKLIEEKETILFSKCININKRLAAYASKRLREIGITKKYIYPDARKIVQQALAKTK